MYFNSRPHEEVDRQGIPKTPEELEFQLTTSRRGRPKQQPLCAERMEFQLTTSRRGRPTRVNNFYEIQQFQLTTSRRGRPFPLNATESPLFISTHDLTKRSTCLFKHKDHFQSISTHDLTKRSTRSTTTLAVKRLFQLTTSRRGRQQNCIFYSSLLHLLLAHCTNNLYPIIIIYIILTF